MKNAFQKSIQSRLALVLIVVLAAFLAAFLGQVLVTSVGGGPTLSTNQSFIVSQTEDPIKDIQKAHNLVTSLEQASFFAVFNATLTQSFTEGVILSNDGWAVALDTDESTLASWSMARLESGELVTISEVIQDPASDLVFLRLDSEALTPVTLAREWSPEVFEAVLVYGQGGIPLPTMYLGSHFTQDLLISSDTVNRFHLIDAMTEHGKVFSKDAEFLGLSQMSSGKDYSQVYTAVAIRQLFDEVVRSGKIVRPSLLLTYQDLSQNSNKVATQGALIKENLSKNTVQVGDIVLSADGILFNESLSLSDALLQKSIGDSIDLGVLRNGQTINLEVSL
jgi:hypothetical protein